MKLYFAAPLFSQAELAFNRALSTKLEQAGFRVFLPQRDGVEKHKPAFKHMQPQDRRQKMFALDRDQIIAAEIFLMILDGRVPDEGACVELGMAYMHKYYHQPSKLLIGLHTDNRAAFLQSKLNPMIRVALDQVTDSQAKLLTVLEGYQTQKNGLRHCRPNENNS